VLAYKSWGKKREKRKVQSDFPLGHGIQDKKETTKKGKRDVLLGGGKNIKGPVHDFNRGESKKQQSTQKTKKRQKGAGYFNAGKSRKYRGREMEDCGDT